MPQEAERLRVPLDQIEPNPRQPRKFFGQNEIDDLARSIRERGLLQPPRVRRVAADRFMLILGERRWRGYTRAHEKGWVSQDGRMPVDVVETTDREMSIDAIVENLQRVDISPIEEARAYQQALDDGMTLPELSTQLGILQYRIEEKLALLELDEQGQKLVATGQIAVTTASVIGTVENANDRNRLVKAIASGKLNGIMDVRAAVQGIHEARAQCQMFEDAPAPSNQDREAVGRLERKVDGVIAMIGAGFQEGECVAAKRCAPDRLGTLADKLALAKSTVARMERQIRDAIAQVEILTA